VAAQASRPGGAPRVRIWLGPEPHRLVVRAIEEGGGALVPLPEAEALVWIDEDPEPVRELLHDGITWVQISTAGVERWFEACLIDERRIWTATKGVYDRPIAEHALALMLAAARDLPRFLRAHTWSEPAGRLLTGSTVGIVGAGGIGRALIGLLAPFDVRVFALSRHGGPVPEAAISAGPDRLDELLAVSDFVVLAVPHTPETTRMLSASRLARMRSDAWLVNVCRGSVVDTDALVHALAAGTLGGAALDVTDPEPLPDGHPLWSLPNVIITPHAGASTPDGGFDLFAAYLRENVRRRAEGEPLVGVVDAARGY
jgi:D-3-phosphoglycerate dehydrogenase